MSTPTKFQHLDEGKKNGSEDLKLPYLLPYTADRLMNLNIFFFSMHIVE